MSDPSSNKTFRPDLLKRERHRPDGPIEPAKKQELKPTVQAEKRSLLEYLPKNLSDEQRTKMQAVGQRIKKYQHVSKLPMLCMGLQCPFARYCELVENDIDLPIGDPCPLEDFAVDAFIDEFKEHYNLDEKDPQSFWILQLMRDLAGDTVVSTRINMSLALDPEPVESTFGGIAFGGQALSITKLQPTLDYMLRLNNSKLKLIKEMLGTPKAKAEVGQLGANDPSSSTSDAQARANKLRKLAESGAVDQRDERGVEKPALPRPQVQKLDFDFENTHVPRTEES